jgi:hypothetical protein
VRGDVVCRVREDWLEDCSQSDGSQTFVAECPPHQVPSHQGVTCTCSYSTAAPTTSNTIQANHYNLSRICFSAGKIYDIPVSKGSAVSMIEWRLPTRQG